MRGRESSRFTSPCRTANIPPAQRTGRSAARSVPCARSIWYGRRPTRTWTPSPSCTRRGRRPAAALEAPGAEPVAPSFRLRAARLEPTPDDGPARTHPVRPRRIKPTFGDCRARGVAPRIRPLVVPMVPPPLPESRLAGAPPVVDARSRIEAGDEHVAGPPRTAADDSFPLLGAVAPGRSVAGRSAWLAVFFAAACVLVALVEYRGRLLRWHPRGAARAEQVVGRGSCPRR